MKNILKIFIIFILLMISSVLKTDDLLQLQNNDNYYSASDIPVISEYFKELPCVISENNSKQEISQSKNENNQQLNAFSRHSSIKDFYNRNYILTKQKKYIFNKNNYISSNLENTIYTRAP